MKGDEKVPCFRQSQHSFWDPKVFKRRSSFEGLEHTRNIDSSFISYHADVNKKWHGEGGGLKIWKNGPTSFMYGWLVMYKWVISNKWQSRHRYRNKAKTGNSVHHDLTHTGEQQQAGSRSRRRHQTRTVQRPTARSAAAAGSSAAPRSRRTSPRPPPTPPKSSRRRTRRSV